MRDVAWKEASRRHLERVLPLPNLQVTFKSIIPYLKLEEEQVTELKALHKALCSGNPVEELQKFHQRDRDYIVKYTAYSAHPDYLGHTAYCPPLLKSDVDILKLAIGIIEFTFSREYGEKLSDPRRNPVISTHAATELTDSAFRHVQVLVGSEEFNARLEAGLVSKDQMNLIFYVLARFIERIKPIIYESSVAALKVKDIEEYFDKNLAFLKFLVRLRSDSITSRILKYLDDEKPTKQLTRQA
jgi:hypothetical protein